MFTGSAIERGKLSSAERFPSSIPTTTALRSRRRFPLCTPIGETRPRYLNGLLADRNSLAQLDEQCRSWWRKAKIDYPKKISALAERCHAAR